MSEKLTNPQLLNNISALLESARSKVVATVNHTMVLTYFEIGRMIVEEEQNGQNRAEYGKSLLKDLSIGLTQKFGRGFSEDNLGNMRKFYLNYNQNSISETPSRKLKIESSETPSIQFENVNNFQQNMPAESQSSISSTSLTKFENVQKKFTLSWSHYLKLMRMDDVLERNFYEIESFKNNWSLRELQRQYDSGLFARLSLSKNTKEILELSQKGQIITTPKDPYILEFLGLNDKSTYSESDLEQNLIDKLEHFLLELGTGFTFVSRQQRISFDEKHFRIDLVFYNRILKSFVLIDLKIGELKHQDIGQMQMYVNYYDREIKLTDENKTIGIILCQDKSEALVQYTLPENNEQIFASKYQTILPSKESLKKLLEENL